MLTLVVGTRPEIVKMAPVARALAEIRKRAAFVKWLGSYPRGDGASAAGEKN